MAEPYRVLVERDVPCRTRDGVTLRADIYRPDAPGRFPSLLERTPYNKSGFMRPTPPIDILRAAQGGHVVAVQDTRGRFASDGTFRPFHQEAQDGADAVEWLAGLPYSNGRVGLFGSSYAGATQWLAAAEAPPSLRAISPVRSSADYYQPWTYQGGAFQLGFVVNWLLGPFAPNLLRRALAGGADGVPQPAELVQAVEAMSEQYGRQPLLGGMLGRLAGGLMPFAADWVNHPTPDDYWRTIDALARAEQVVVPALNVGGWYDIFLQGTLRAYTELRRRAGSSRARQGQRLLIGPWVHGAMVSEIGELGFGTQANGEVWDFSGLCLDWLDRHLAEDEPSPRLPKPVRIFVMGANVWRDEEDWPLPRAVETPFFLHSLGKANTLHGDGVLDTTPPGDERADHFLYDPLDPVPTLGGATLQAGHATFQAVGPKDQRPVERRPDVLVYTSAPLERDLEVTGPVLLRLYASTSGRDTDWTAKLVDVYPDGRAMLLTDGILRARYRHSLHEPRFLEPGRVEEYLVDLVATSNVFKAGHRLRLEVSSSNFPRFDRNPNTEAVPALARPEQFQPALQTVLHDRRYPSALLLPVVGQNPAPSSAP